MKFQDLYGGLNGHMGSFSGVCSKLIRWAQLAHGLIVCCLILQNLWWAHWAHGLNRS